MNKIKGYIYLFHTKMFKVSGQLIIREKHKLFSILFWHEIYYIRNSFDQIFG